MSRMLRSRPVGGVAVVLTDLVAGGLAHAHDLMTPAAAIVAGAASLAGLVMTARGLADAVLPRE